MGRLNPIPLMIRNWKKTLFIAPTLSTALYYTYDYNQTLNLMRTKCKQVSKLGDDKLRNFNGETRHITVILNPVAGKRKARKLYTNWVEPLFHLAGIKISVIETDSPNQASELMKVMSNCDGVAIVGGDGTVNEVINGLISRPDCLNASNKFPIAIIPVGQFNSIARNIYGDLNYRNYKEFMILSAMNLIESKTKSVDIIKIESRIPDEKPIYALQDIRYGKYQDNFHKLSGYMIYQDYIKPYWLRFRRSLGNHNKPKIESLFYTEPCAGCTKCHEKHTLRNTDGIESDTNVIQKRWWTGLIGSTKSSTTPRVQEKLKENPNCDRLLSVEDVGSISEVRGCLMNEKKIKLSIFRNGQYEPTEIFEVQDVKLNVDPELDKLSQQVEEKEQKEKGQSGKFLIDGQPIKVRSVEITTLSKAVRIFTKKPALIE